MVIFISIYIYEISAFEYQIMAFRTCSAILSSLLDKQKPCRMFFLNDINYISIGYIFFSEDHFRVCVKKFTKTM